MSDELDARDAEKLADLKKHWDEAFEFIHYPGGRWYAIPKTGCGEPLIADTDDELRQLVRATYKPGSRS